MSLYRYSPSLRNHSHDQNTNQYSTRFNTIQLLIFPTQSLIKHYSMNVVNGASRTGTHNMENVSGRCNKTSSFTWHPDCEEWHPDCQYYVPALLKQEDQNTDTVDSFTFGQFGPGEINCTTNCLDRGGGGNGIHEKLKNVPTNVGIGIKYLATDRAFPTPRSLSCGREADDADRIEGDQSCNENDQSCNGEDASYLEGGGGNSGKFFKRKDKNHLSKDDLNKFFSSAIVSERTRSGQRGEAVNGNECVAADQYRVADDVVSSLHGGTAVDVLSLIDTEVDENENENKNVRIISGCKGSLIF